MHDTTTQQIEKAYRQMADEARYRPKAPSDGFGTITAPLAECDLDAEARAYAESWNRDEDEHQFWVGCCHYDYRPAVIFAIEAVRNMNAGIGGRPPALDLLRMAVAALESAS